MTLTKHAVLIAAIPLFSMPALAQDTTSDSIFELDEIITTARKRSESSADVPLQISTFSGEEIAKRNYLSLHDIGQATAGLEYEDYVTAGLSTAPVIRGQAQTFTTSRIQNTSVFFDGIYLQRQSMVNPGLVDLARVEVVKGPQNAVYGRNAFAGAINYVSKKPGDTFEFEFKGTLGSDDREDLSIAVGGPIVKGLLAARVFAASSEYDGHTDNDHPFARQGPQGSSMDKVGGWEDEVVSAAVSFTPSDSVTIHASYYRNEMMREPLGSYSLSAARWAATDNSWDAASNQGNCVNSMTTAQIGPTTIPIFGNHAYCGELPTSRPFDPMLAAMGIPDGDLLIDPRSFVMDGETEILQATIDWDITDDWSLSYQYGKVDHDGTGHGVTFDRQSVVGALTLVNAIPNPNFPPVPPPFFPVLGNATTFNANPNNVLTTDSHELRVSWRASDAVTTRFGLYVSETEDSDFSAFFFVAPCDNPATCTTAVPQSPGVIFVPPVVFGHGAMSNLAHYEDDVNAIFADVSWDINDNWTLIAEGRLENEDRSFLQETATFGLPAPFTASEEFDFFTPRATLQYRPDGDRGHHYYGLAARGVKTGGFNAVDLAINPEQATFGEESAWTYEIGGKGLVIGERLLLNGAAYFIDWKDIQGTEAANDPNPFATDVTGTIGDATVVGVELDGILQLSDAFSIDFALTWMRPEYDNAHLESAQTINADGSPDLTSSYGCTDLTPECHANGSLSGNTLERTSTQTASIGLRYQGEFNDWDTSARLDFNYRDELYATPLNLAHSGSRTVSNGNFTMSNDRFTVSLWAKNLFDEEYVGNSFVLHSFNQYVVGLGARRSYGITASVQY